MNFSLKKLLLSIFIGHVCSVWSANNIIFQSKKTWPIVTYWAKKQRRANLIKTFILRKRKNNRCLHPEIKRIIPTARKKIIKKYGEHAKKIKKRVYGKKQRGPKPNNIRSLAIDLIKGPAPIFLPAYSMKSIDSVNTIEEFTCPRNGILYQFMGAQQSWPEFNCAPRTVVNAYTLDHLATIAPDTIYQASINEFVRKQPLIQCLLRHGHGPNAPELLHFVRQLGVSNWFFMSLGKSNNSSFPFISLSRGRYIKYSEYDLPDETEVLIRHIKNSPNITANIGIYLKTSFKDGHLVLVRIQKRQGKPMFMIYMDSNNIPLSINHYKSPDTKLGVFDCIKMLYKAIA